MEKILDKEIEVISIKVKLRKAVADDLKVDNKNLKIGQPFWLRSNTTGEFDNKNYLISEETDPYDIFKWLQFGMIWIPESDIK
jgi:hypothetical protein